MTANGVAHIPQLASLEINFDSQDQFYQIKYSAEDAQFLQLLDWFKAKFSKSSVHDFLIFKEFPSNVDPWHVIQLRELVSAAYRNFNGNPPFQKSICPCLAIPEQSIRTYLSTFQKRIHGDALAYVQKQTKAGTLCDICHPSMNKLVELNDKRLSNFRQQHSFFWMKSVFAILHPKDKVVDLKNGVLYIQSDREPHEIWETYQILDIEVQKV